MKPIDRRAFFKIVAASGAAAAAGGCGQSPEKYLPYVTPPENIVPGVPSYFSTVCRECPAGCGLVAKNRDGRTIKREGNPDHPLSAGTLCIRGQAGLQSLYHPDRFRRASAGGKPIGWDEAPKPLSDKLGGLLKANQGARGALVTGAGAGAPPPPLGEWGRAPRARPRLRDEAPG